MRLILTILFFILAAIASLTIGPGAFGIPSDPQVLEVLRLPRMLLAIAVGGGISIAGCLAQASLSNPLADPFTLGVASAAALGAVLASFLFKGMFFVAPIFAFLFALGTLFFLFFWLRHRFRSSTEILLTGVIIGLFCSAFATFFQAVTDPSAWSLNLGWLLGSLSLRTLDEAIGALLIVLVLVAMTFVHWKILDLISVSELLAETSGIDLRKYRMRFFIILSVLTALCVSCAGIIGFLGFLVPHLARRLKIKSYKALIPATFFLGAAILLLSDVLARTMISGTEIPVGVLTALIGAPGFLVLFRKENANA